MKDNRLFIGKVIALILVILSVFYAIYEVKDLRHNSTISVARIYNLSFTKGVSKNAHYEYYFKGERYRGGVRLKTHTNKKILNKFFEVKFSKENPRNSQIDLAIEVKDTNRIKRANFNIN